MTERVTRTVGWLGQPVRRAARRVLTGRLEDRLAGTIDRRVRLEVARRLAAPGGADEQLAESARRVARLDELVRRIDELPDDEAVLALVAREVERHAEATRPRPGQRDRDFTAALLLGAGRPNDRTLSEPVVARLRTEVAAVTGVAGAETSLRQAYRTLLEHEGRGLGRIAATTANILGKLVVPPLLAPPAGPVLEIGTLFGLFSSALVRQHQHVGEFRSLTVVDPFTGTQVQDGRAGGRDRTGTPVTEDVARRNLTALGLRDDEVRLVRGYSTDEEVRRQVADRAYALVVVDGDHAAEASTATCGGSRTWCCPAGSSCSTTGATRAGPAWRRPGGATSPTAVTSSSSAGWRPRPTCGARPPADPSPDPRTAA